MAWLLGRWRPVQRLRLESRCRHVCVEWLGIQPATRPPCLEDMLRRQVQKDVRGDDLFMLDAFRLYSFLPLRVECDPIFHSNYWSSGRVLSLLLFCKNNLDSPCIMKLSERV
ncbi:hypothetical protein AVEN_114997-1 [Araneus ventricosus]|uniref:Uncharacterized protein n=1 Tax=Araneus ventricosus TaxID=182803 RepID=A0A4Y1ZWT7_ARAVE|nr:hypothetical protein AVEN_114997-1 [Araneus ventricosus]